MKNMDVHKDKFIVRHYHKRQIEVKGHKRKLKDYLRGNEPGSYLEFLLEVTRNTNITEAIVAR
ncbi:MAG: hypothetical protein IMY78_02280 [Chloroflexi bacterium]|nr:hypothetical protein [Chloroflexota bacterium]